MFTAEQWAETANRFWPRSDGTSWLPAQIDALREAGKFSRRLIELLQRGSGASIRKPKLVARLSELLTTRDEVPADLIKAFERVLDFVRPGAAERL